MVGDGHSVGGRAVLAGTGDQASANNDLGAGINVLRVVDDDRGLVTTPAAAGVLEKTNPISTGSTIPGQPVLWAKKRRENAPNPRVHTFHHNLSCSHNHSPFESTHHQ